MRLVTLLAVSLLALVPSLTRAGDTLVQFDRGIGVAPLIVALVIAEEPIPPQRGGRTQNNWIRISAISTKAARTLGTIVVIQRRKTGQS